MLLMLVIVGAVIYALFFYVNLRETQKKAALAQTSAPPAAVTTLIAKPQTWQPVLSAIGSLKAVNGVDISADLSGIISEIAFESGKPVKKGDLLVRLDTKQEEAQLAAAQAWMDLARANLARKEDLLNKKAASQADYDAAAAEARQTVAAVDEIRAAIARKTITAPFDGITGIRQVNIGQYLSTGTTVVSLESRDPIYVQFSIPQQHLSKVNHGRKIRLTASGVDDVVFEGEITAIDSRVDETTRNIQIEATVPNPQGQLRTGMFANVEVLLPPVPGVLAVPASSIDYTPYGDTVWLVKEAKAVQQFVTLGASRGDQIAIVKGIQEGDEVITSGAFKLRPNISVEVNNAIQPSNEEYPKPPDT